MNTLRICLLTAVLAGLMSSPAYADWLFYYLPSLEGQVVDIDTKEPIEGAVVVIAHSKETYGIVDTFDSVVAVREGVTDKEGKFRIPAYFTLMQPLSWSSRPHMEIYKPGYVHVNGIAYEYFTGEMTSVQEYNWRNNPNLKYRYLPNGTIEMAKVVSMEDRKMANPDPLGNERFYEQQPKFIEAIRNEWQFLFNKNPGNLYRTREK